MLGVQQQCHVQYAGFQRGVLHIRAQHPQKVLCGGKAGVRAVDIHTGVFFVVVIGVVAVHRQHGENARQLDALAQHIGGIQIRHLGVVGGQRQHAARHAVHDIVAGRFHNDIAGKVGGHGAALAQHRAELLQLLRGGQLAEQQQVARFLKGKAAAAAAVDQVFYVVAAVQQLTVRRELDPVHIPERPDIRNIGQACQHALAGLIAQAGLYPELPVEILGDAVVLCTKGLLLVEVA